MMSRKTQQGRESEREAAASSSYETVQSTTLEAELVSSGSGEGDPCSVCLPAPSRSLSPSALPDVVGRRRLFGRWGAILIAPHSTGDAVRMWLEESSVQEGRGVDEREGGGNNL